MFPSFPSRNYGVGKCLLFVFCGVGDAGFGEGFATLDTGAAFATVLVAATIA